MFMQSAQKRPGDRPDAAVAASVYEDFQALVDILGSQFAAFEPGDGEARSQVARAKAAAERGVKLAQRLVEDAS